MKEKHSINSQNATVVYQMTEDQLLSFAHQVVAETRDSVADEVHRRIAEAMGGSF